MNLCPLCKSPTSSVIFTGFYDCGTCRGIFRSADAFVSEEQEKARYLLHQNKVDDEGYQQFVAPIIQAVTRDFSPTDKGLDFGSGPEPVVTQVLTGRGYSVTMYDPFFHHVPEALESTYDYIICCEVMEHFHHPDLEFDRLKSLLIPGGKLFCKTAVYHDSIDFSRWYYKNDRTHVFFYRRETVEWIAVHFRFKAVHMESGVFIFETSDHAK